MNNNINTIHIGLCLKLYTLNLLRNKIIILPQHHCTTKTNHNIFVDVIS